MTRKIISAIIAIAFMLPCGSLACKSADVAETEDTLRVDVMSAEIAKAPELTVDIVCEDADNCETAETVTDNDFTADACNDAAEDAPTVNEVTSHSTESEICQEPIMCWDEQDVIAMAQMLWGEARACTETDKRNCCITVCNRADDYRYPNGIYECISQPNQYLGYSPNNPVTFELYDLALKVLYDWGLKKQGLAVDWSSYNSFWGDGVQNHFYVW